MLTLTIATDELFDERTQTFIEPKKQTITLEHSLVSLSKWESLYGRPFFSKQGKTPEETVEYVKCMTVTQKVDPDIYRYLSSENIKRINQYIEAPMTATTFGDNGKGKGGREIITAEIIYYWMIAFNIPFECQKWHLNRLLTLVKVCNIKNQPPKKQSKSDMLRRNAALNAARRKQANSRG